MYHNWRNNKSDNVKRAEKEANDALMELKEFLYENVGSHIIRGIIMSHVREIADKHEAIVSRAWADDIDAGLQEARSNVSGVLSDLLSKVE